MGFAAGHEYLTPKKPENYKEPLQTEASETTEVSKSTEQTESQMIQDMLQELEQEQQVLDKTESVESVPLGNERFEAEVSGYLAFMKLAKDEVQFLDADNRPVGEPQAFADFVGPKDNFDGDYLYTPGVVAESGILSDVPAKEWRDYVAEQVQSNFPEQEIVDNMNTVRLFQSAYATGDATLVQKIENGEVSHLVDILSHFIHKDVPSSRSYDKADYLSTHVQFRSRTEAVPGVPGVEMVAVPPVVQAEFRRLLPGLFAQESGYKEDLVNPKSGAKGYGQYMPDTWERYTGTTEVSTDFVDQVEVLGPCVSDMYDRVLDKVGESALDVYRNLFPDEETFLVELVVPLTISGYNAGPDRIAFAAKRFAESVQVNDMPTGKDLFIAIVNYAEQSNEGLLDGYGPEAREYVTRVYANAQIVAEVQQQDRRIRNGERIAQN